MPERWPIEIASPLAADEARARLAAATEPRASRLSMHVGSGGRYLYGDHGAARRFEGEIDGDRFALQRIHYRGMSHGPRLWSEGEIRAAPAGCTVGLRHRLRAETYAGYAVWTVLLVLLAGFGAYLGFGDRLAMVMGGTAAILALGYGFLAIGLVYERRVCTALLRAIFDAD